MKSFLCLEGLDGSGKSTQVELLFKWLNYQELKFKYLHFPKTDYFPYGDMIANFLRGDFGSLESVNPYLVALIYALDRMHNKPLIEKWIADGNFVLVDRYVYSNIAFQTAKIKSENEKESLRKWIYELEFEYHKLPKPDLSIYLNVPLNFVYNTLSKERTGSSRQYLNGKPDIHENSLALQERVRDEYIKLALNNNDIIIIDCFSDDNKILDAGVIHNKILEVLKQRG